MSVLKALVIPLAALCLATTLRAAPSEGAVKVVLAIHGGAGVLPRGQMTPALEARYRKDLETALREGSKALRRQGGTGLDAVEAAIKVLEDSPRFNAGKGAVFTHDGRNELDAALMEGKERRAGAVAGVTRVKNPIAAARAVMEKSEHVLLVGPGADQFAREQGLEMVDPSYFRTPERWKELEDTRRQEKTRKGKGPRGRAPGPVQYLGTVGAVALDRQGNLAAGTSTGGLTNKRYGRVGDSPLIGAGTYAENEACAVSATGHGEVFIRYVVAHDIAARVKYRKESVTRAAQTVLDGLPREPGGVGGVIVLNRQGNLTMPFNTEGMYRGYVTSDGAIHVMIYK